VQTERNKRTGESPSVEAVAEALSEGQPEALQPLLLQENARVQKRASIVQVRTSRCCLVSYSLYKVRRQVERQEKELAFKWECQKLCFQGSLLPATAQSGREVLR
jgi:hypothetical protein